MSWIVVRVRSNVNVERSIRETMDYLNLTKVNHAVIIPENEQYRGMLQKAKDYITWGEATETTVEKMLSERGRMSGDSPLTDGIVKDSTDFKNIPRSAQKRLLKEGMLLVITYKPHLVVAVKRDICGKRALPAAGE